MSEIRRILVVVGVGLGLIWIVSLAGFARPEIVQLLALSPRTVEGLTGILTMPLVHGSLVHLSVNTSAYAVLAALVAARSTKYYVFATGQILLMGGAVLWLGGRPGAHIGASMMVFGYFGLLATRGVFERRFLSILLSLGVAVLFGGLLWGIVPGEDGVSWDGHLAGLLAGIAAAWTTGRATRARATRADRA